MVDDPEDWLCVICRRGRPSGALNASLVDNIRTGTCDNLDCPSKKDKGTKKRPPAQATFRRIHAGKA